MKEPTPITSEEFLKGQGIEIQYESIIPTDKAIKCMEQYAQSKVLEALEREVPKAYINGVSSFVSLTPKGIQISEEEGKDYYKTEVKPKYEN